jgi:hypothetical protein
MIALKDALADQVAHLTDVTVTDRTGAENVAAVLAAYERGLERVAKVLVSMNRLDIAARRVDVEAEKVRIVVEAIRRALWSDHAGLDYDDSLRIMEAIDIEFSTLPVAS